MLSENMLRKQFESDNTYAAVSVTGSHTNDWLPNIQVKINLLRRRWLLELGLEVVTNDIDGDLCRGAERGVTKIPCRHGQLETSFFFRTLLCNAFISLCYMLRIHRSAQFNQTYKISGVLFVSSQRLSNGDLSSLRPHVEQVLRLTRRH